MLFILQVSILSEQISISTIPSHIYSTILSFAKVTCNTHKNKKLLSIPLKLVPSLAKLPTPLLPPFHWEEHLLTPKTSHSIFWRRAGRLLCSALSLISFVAELFMVSRLPVFFMTFSIESSCDVFMRICLCFNVLFLRFCRENGGGGGVMDLVFGSSSSFDMDCEVKIVCCYYRFAYIVFA